MKKTKDRISRKPENNFWNPALIIRNPLNPESEGASKTVSDPLHRAKNKLLLSQLNFIILYTTHRQFRLSKLVTKLELVNFQKFTLVLILVAGTFLLLQQGESRHVIIATTLILRHGKGKRQLNFVLASESQLSMRSLDIQLYLS